jgi:hypothetical protein
MTMDLSYRESSWSLLLEKGVTLNQCNCPSQSSGNEKPQVCFLSRPWSPTPQLELADASEWHLYVIKGGAIDRSIK